jgi:hypothetical protein
MYLNTEKLPIFITNDIIRGFRFTVQRNNIDREFKLDQFYYDQNISCQIFAHSVNNETVSRQIQDLALSIQFLEEVKQLNTYSIDEKQLIRQNIVFLLVTLFCSPSDSSLASVIVSIPNTPKSFRLKLSRFMVLLRSVYNGVYANPDLKNKFVTDLIQFMKVISTYVAVVTRQIVDTSFISSCHMPSYVTKTLQYRIFACMLLPDQSEVTRIIQNISMPRNYLLTRRLTSTEQYIDPFVFKRIIKYLPQKNLLEMDSIDAFMKAIWRTHLYTPPELLKHFPKYRHVKMEVVFNEVDILAQALALSLPNWKQMWFHMKWPINFEIMKRLNFLKEKTKWKIQEEELVSYLLSINAE